MTDEKTSKPRDEGPGVEADAPPTRRLAIMITALTVVIFVVILGLWRFFVYQTRIEKERKAVSEAGPVKKLRKENLRKLDAPAMKDPKTGKQTIPILKAMKRLVENPQRLRPIPMPPKKWEADRARPKPVKTPPPRPRTEVKIDDF